MTAMHPPLLEPGMRHTMWTPAGTVNMPGKGEFPETVYLGETVAWGKVISADVAEDGSGVSITYEIQSDA